MNLISVTVSNRSRAVFFNSQLRSCAFSYHRSTQLFQAPALTRSDYSPHTSGPAESLSPKGGNPTVGVKSDTHSSRSGGTGRLLRPALGTTLLRREQSARGMRKLHFLQLPPQLTHTHGRDGLKPRHFVRGLSLTLYVTHVGFIKGPVPQSGHRRK